MCLIMGISMKRPLVLCGPSGAGKSVLIARLLQEYPTTFGFSVSHTTRAPRPQEVHGEHYFFTTRSEMQTSIAKGGFLEYAEVHANLYGTGLEGVRAIAKQKICILDLDIQGVTQVRQFMDNPDTKDMLPRPRYIFIRPPTLAILEQRLRSRNTDTEEQIQRRLATARLEWEHQDEFDHVIVNDQLDTAYQTLKSLLQPDLK